MLNWIVWNRTVYLYKMDLALNNLLRWYIIKHKQPTNLSSRINLGEIVSMRKNERMKVATIFSNQNVYCKPQDCESTISSIFI